MARAYSATRCAGIEGSAAVFDAEAAAGIEVLNVDAVGAEVFDERAHALDGFGEGLRVADLRTDVNADAGGLMPLRLAARR